MGSDLPVISKRVWSMVRVVFFMLRKGFNKPKLLMHLNLILKRPRKLAEKAIADLISHNRHCHHGTSAASNNAHLQFSTAREYEFSCSSTPKDSFFSKRHIPRQFFACVHAPLTQDDNSAAVNNALRVSLEMLDGKKSKDVVEASSSALPGFGRTPAAPQPRGTDHPILVQDDESNDGDHQVDKAADEFIERIFNELRKQS